MVIVKFNQKGKLIQLFILQVIKENVHNRQEITQNNINAI